MKREIKVELFAVVRECITVFFTGIESVGFGRDGKRFRMLFTEGENPDMARWNPVLIRDFDEATLVNRRIVTGKHCFGCTAGCGSSCGGVLT